MRKNCLIILFMIFFLCGCSLCNNIVYTKDETIFCLNGDVLICDKRTEKPISGILVYNSTRDIFNNNSFISEEQVLVKLQVKDGKLDGIAKEYSENNTLVAEYGFKEGKSDGLLREYYNNGKLKIEKLRKNGRPIWKKKYSENGDVVCQIDFSIATNPSMEELEACSN